MCCIGCLDNDSDIYSKYNLPDDKYVIDMMSNSDNGSMIVVGTYIGSVYYAGYVEDVEIGEHKPSWWRGNDNGADIVYLRGGMIPASNAHKYTWINGKLVVLNIMNGRITEMRYVNEDVGTTVLDNSDLGSV